MADIRNKMFVQNNNSEILEGERTIKDFLTVEVNNLF